MLTPEQIEGERVAFMACAQADLMVSGLCECGWDVSGDPYAIYEDRDVGDRGLVGFASEWAAWLARAEIAVGEGEAKDAEIERLSAELEREYHAGMARSLDGMRDIWQHDETGRITERPHGKPSPGPRWVLVATTNAPWNTAEIPPPGVGDEEGTPHAR